MTPEAKNFKLAVWQAVHASSAACETICEWVALHKATRYSVHVGIFLRKGQRLDIDNGLKVTLDALKDSGVLHSDAAVMRLSVAMGRDATNPRTEIEVEVL